MDRELKAFFHSVSGCTLCYGRRQEIFVPEPDDVPEAGTAPILVIGEQPDREHCLPAGRNGIGNAGPGAEMIRAFLEKAGIDRSDVFYTTCVLCVPLDGSLRSGRPSFGEAKNCNGHLERLVNLVRPKIIIPLGHTAIQSVQWIHKDWTELRQFIVNYDIGNVLERNGLVVYPLYYPSPNSLKARPEARQIRDWQRIPAILESLRRNAATE